MTQAGVRSSLLVAGALLLCACAGAAAPETTSGSTATSIATSTVVSSSTSESAPPDDTTIVSEPSGGEPVDAASLAVELSTIEAGLRASDVSQAVSDELGRRQQLAYRVVNRHPEWHSQLLELVDPIAVGPLTLHLAARQALVDHSADRPPADPVTTLPAWTIVAPLPIDELRSYYDEAEAATGVPWQYLAAIHFQETRMGRVVGVSSAGAVGPMQFLPSTWAACCEGDPTVARDAILGAARYLAMHGAPADMTAALTAYNPNTGYVGAVTAYAQNLIGDERAYLGYHGWEVFYGTSEGTVRLPAGYSTTAPIAVATYLRDHPQDLLSDV